MMQEWLMKMAGRGRLPNAAVFLYIRNHFLEEPARSRFIEFWRSAEAIAALPNRSFVPALPQAYAHCLRESLDAVWKSGDPRGGPWREVSRAVVDARARFEIATGVGGDEADAALGEMLSAIDAMANFHNSVPAEVRGLTNLIYEKTGAQFVGVSPHPAQTFHKIKQELASLAHSSGSWDEAVDLRNRAVAELSRLFRPPTEQIEEIRSLARTPSPGPHQIKRFESVVTNDHHLRFFLAEVPDLEWLVALGPHDILAPSQEGGSWSIVLLVERFTPDSSETLLDWLNEAHDAWRLRPNAPAAIAAAAGALGVKGEALMLQVLKEFSTDSGVRWHATVASRHAEASSDFVSEVAAVLLGVEEEETNA